MISNVVVPNMKRLNDGKSRRVLTNQGGTNFVIDLTDMLHFSV